MKYLRLISFVFFLFFYSLSLYCSNPIKIKLYPDGATTSNELEKEQESYDEKNYRNISDPEIEIFVPTNQKERFSQTMLIIPGGSYSGIAVSHEGYKTIEWLNKHGIIGVLLKYRLPNGHPDIPLEDAIRAMQILKENADKLGIDKKSIGVMGFSAGGHLASSLLTKYGDSICRPDFGVLVYPVIDLQYKNGATGENLLGKHYEPPFIMQYSTYNYITQETPPVCLILTDDDKVVPPANSIEFYNALKKNGISSELHIFPEGNHGWWMRERYKYADETYEIIMRWIKSYAN